MEIVPEYSNIGIIERRFPQYRMFILLALESSTDDFYRLYMYSESPGSPNFWLTKKSDEELKDYKFIKLKKVKDIASRAYGFVMTRAFMTEEEDETNSRYYFNEMMRDLGIM